jgi:transketolase
VGRPLVRLGLRDTFAHGASKAYLLKKYGLDAWALTQAIEAMVGRSSGLDPEDLAQVHLTPVHSASKAEAP